MSTTTKASRPPVPRFEPLPCVLGDLPDVDGGSEFELECGDLVVLEDRSRPSGPVVRLPVAIARTANGNALPDPVVYLAGGGGHAHLNYGAWMIDNVGSAFVADRDFIQYNQRGAPDTDPPLDCPGLTEFLFDLANDDISYNEWADRHTAYLRECRDRLVGQGIDLSQYNSAVNAADAADLLLALGYDQANFYGTSYGTRLGLALVRDFPESVRSIILDSVYPPEVGYYTEYATTIDRALSALFDSCSSQPKCADRFPKLEEEFYSIVDRLNDDPARVTASFGRMWLDGGTFMDAIAVFLYSPRSVVVAPMAIERAANGDYSMLSQVLVGAITAPEINWAMFYSMQCREEVPYESMEQAEVLAENLPAPVVEQFTDQFADFHFSLCEDWGSGQADPAAAVRVESDIPALVFAGVFDPATPPGWSRSAAAGLSNSFFFEFPGEGHGVMRSNGCGLEIGVAFVDDPASPPDASCLVDEKAPLFDLSDG
ncbi:MAG: alpha/beta fold hydrolase [Acidimicrobiia bacterium]